MEDHAFTTHIAIVLHFQQYLQKSECVNVEINYSLSPLGFNNFFQKNQAHWPTFHSSTMTTIFIKIDPQEEILVNIYSINISKEFSYIDSFLQNGQVCLQVPP